MNSKTIDEVFERNAAAGEALKHMIDSLPAEKCSRLPDGEKWTIAGIVEHVALVEMNMIRICARLLSKAEAEDRQADGRIAISESFGLKAAEIAAIKLEAPEVVHPTGEKTIDESLAKFEENWQSLLELKSAFEKYDSNEHRYPHPFLGDLSAGEWLTLIGGHKLRHMKQIENLAERI